MNRLQHLAYAVGLAAALLAAPLRAEVTLNLKDAEITTLIATVSEVTGKNFIVDSRVKGKVTVISSSPMSAASLYETFLAVLQVNGFAAVPVGAAIKIIPENNARSEGTTYGAAVGLAKDEIVTQVYQVENVSAAQLVPILRPLVPQWGHLAAYPPSNILIISDRAANVARLHQLIRQMDQVGDRDVLTVKLENAIASEVVRILTSLTQQDKQADPGMRQTSIVADERTNAVLISGDKSEQAKYQQIIRQLDQAGSEGGSTQVIYLRYASSENLAPILEGYAQQVQTEQRTSAAGNGAAAAAAAPPPVSPGGGSSSFSGARVLADKDTNALIVTAPPKTMRQIRDVIAQLDIQRSQVLVEAIIAEVSANKTSQLGIDWAVFNQNRVAAAGILNPNTLNALSAIGTAGTDAAGLAALGQGINLVGGRVGGNGTSFALLLKALQGDGDTNVLSTPTLLTMDNEEAKFSVGQEVPFLTGQFSNTGGNNGSLNPFQTIERKDVGLTLGVTPQINEGNLVKLKIDLESSSLSASGAGTLNQITNKRTLTNTVGVEDGQILVIGGLIDDTVSDQLNGVPFLSRLPLLGALFQYRSVSKDKRNLMVFIRPSILRKQYEGDYYTRKKYEAIREAQLKAGRGAVPLLGGQRPLLPSMDEYLEQNARPIPPATVVPAAVTAPAPAVSSGGVEVPLVPDASVAPAPAVSPATEPVAPDVPQTGGAS